MARKCKVVEISSKRKNKFLNTYHIQGEDRSSIKLGLLFDNELVSVMTFCKKRRCLGHKDQNVINNWELSRFCVGNIGVVGAAGKLLSYFKKNYDWNEIITYADLRWSSGNLYEKLGFSLSHISQPNYWYLSPRGHQQREYRYKYAKHSLPQLLENFDPDKSEWENMKAHGYDRIWDCGNLVYVMEKN